MVRNLGMGLGNAISYGVLLVIPLFRIKSTKLFALEKQFWIKISYIYSMDIFKSILALIFRILKKIFKTVVNLYVNYWL